MKIVHQVGNSQVVIEDVPIPKPGRGEVLIKTAVSALCGSEMHTWRGEGQPYGNSGHEAAGVVVEVGEGAQRLLPGQRVGVSAVVGCGECDYCREGKYTWCDNYTVHSNMHAEYFVIPERGCHLIPDDVSWDVGVLITGDGLGVPCHTSAKIAAEWVETVVVFGLGPVGLGNVLYQSHAGRRVIGIDRSLSRLDIAKKLGATEIIVTEDNVDVPAVIKELTNGRGADVAIEAAGVPATVRLCFASVRKGGMVVFNGEQPALSLSPSDDFIRRDITAVGSWFYHFSEYPKMLELARGGLPVADLITHHFPLADAADGYNAMQTGVSGKVLLTYSC
ncbi:MAG: zinc-binding dehydrogenase [Abditibacteriaceae bacterium]